jgi:hypothetical protein
MNQTPASILVLAASLLGYAALSQTVDNGTGVLVGLAAIALGLWGVISLLGASLRERELIDGTPRTELVERWLGRGAALAGLRNPMPPMPAPQAPAPPVAARRPAMSFDDLPADVKAQLSVMAHLQGKDHSQLVEEALRQYLPRNDRTRAA